MADLNASITNLNQQMAALIQALQPILKGNAPAAAPTPATFATTPGTHTVADIIDYSTRTGTTISTSTALRVCMKIREVQPAE
jgi:hypothetical protein